MKDDTHIQWYNENEGRAYPLSESASRTTNDGRQLPDDILVDMGIMMRPDYSDIYLSCLRITPVIVTLGISYGLRGIFIGTYARDSIVPNKAYPLVPSAVVDDVSGWVVFGTHVATGIEDYRFSSSAQSGIERRAITLVDRVPVARLMRYGGTADQYVNKVVRLVAGSGVTIRVDPNNAQRVLIGLTEELKYATCNKCNEGANSDSCGVAPMRSIDDVCPDANGKLTIEFQ